MSDFTKPIEELAQRVKDYADLQIADVKLRTVKGLSTAMSKLVFIQILVLLLAVVFIALSVGLVLVFGKVFNSYVAGAFVVAGFFALVFVVFVLLRKKMFRNTFVPLFVKLFFGEEK